MSSSADSVEWFKAKYVEIIVRKDSWGKTTRGYRWLSGIAPLVLILGLVVATGLVPPTVEPQDERGILLRRALESYQPYTTVSIILAATALYVISIRMKPDPYPKGLTAEERTYLRFFPILETAHSIKHQNFDATRPQIKKQLVQVAKYINENWKLGTLGVVDSQLGSMIPKFKALFRDRLIRLTLSDNATLDQIRTIMNQIARYLLEPVPEKLKKLNTDLDGLAVDYKTEEIRLTQRLRSNPLVISASVGMVVGIVAFGLTQSTETAVIGAIVIFGIILTYLSRKTPALAV